MIIENSNYNDIRKLFKENNEDYITEWSNEHGIEDKNMLKLVYNEDNISKGYAIICFDKNFCEMMPLSKMRNILALNSVLTETNNENGVTKPFPNAIDSDFKNKNGGIPEIKIWDFVNPNFIIGFVIENPELLNELVNKGISKDKVLVIDPQRDILEQLIEFKKRVLEQEKNHDGQGDNESR